jgi:hypothetical protein
MCSVIKQQLHFVNLYEQISGFIPTYNQIIHSLMLVKRKHIVVLDRRRLGHVYVICVIVLACVGGKRGLGKGPKSGTVNSEHGASKGRSSQLHTMSYHSK